MNLERHRQEWDHLAGLDPLWAILSYRRRKFGRWDPDAFLATGDEQGQRLLERAKVLGHPQRWDAALDLGCGVGRLAPALSDAFGAYYGIDISQTMVTQARELHHSRANCTFLVDLDEGLSRFADQSFDLVFCFHVLQHLTSAQTILAYLASLLRVLRSDGLLVVQLPARIPRAEQLLCHARRGLYARLHRLGAPDSLLYRRLGLFPMTMNFLPAEQVLAVVRNSGARILDIEGEKVGIAMWDQTYYVTRTP